MVYLDNAATTHPKPSAVYEASDDCLRNCSANPGRGGHRMAVEANRIVFEAREKLGELLNIPHSDRIVFTHNATASINAVLFGWLQQGDHCVTSSLEHNAVVRPIHALSKSRGVARTQIQVAENGDVDFDRFLGSLRPNTKLVVLTHASNVGGTILPIARLTQLAHSRGIPVLLDASQSAGAIPIDAVSLGVDFLARPGHKGLFGPQGTGVLYVSESVDLSPYLFGGTGSRSEEAQMPDFLPDRLEAGTVNTPGIAGLAAGVDFLLRTTVETVHAREQFLCDRLIDGLLSIPGIRIHGAPKGPRAPVVSFTIAGHDNASIGDALDSEYSIACRVGLHCAPDAHHSLGTYPSGTVRISPGYFTTDIEIDQTLEAIANLAIRPAKRLAT